MENADLVLWLEAPDTDRVHLPPSSSETPLWMIGTKSDLGASATATDLSLSVRSGAGMPDLLKRLERHIDSHLGTGEVSLVSHLRDRDAIAAAVLAIDSAIAHIDQPELCAEDLRTASDSLSGLVGLIDSEMVLDRLFAGFCIGK